MTFAYDPTLVMRIKTLPQWGRKWDGDARAWIVDSCLLMRLYEIFSDCVVDAPDDVVFDIVERERRAQTSAEETAALASNIPERVNGYVLYAHQREVVAKMISAKKCVVAHEMGLGKTLSALTAAKLLQPRPVHVVAPVSVHETVWRPLARECEVALDGLYSWAKMPDSIPENSVFVADEAHYAQGGATTERGKAFLRLAMQAEFLFCLTGTPMKNDRSLNLFPLLEACGHPIARDFIEFRRRYTNERRISGRGAKPIVIYDGIKNEFELREKISNIVFVKKKRDCIDLPDKIFQWRIVENCLVGDDRDELERGLEILFSNEGDAASYFEKIRRMAKFQMVRRLTSLAKVDGTAEAVQEILDQGDSVVICTAFVDPLNIFVERFREHGVSYIHGGVDAKTRARMVDDFQSGANKVFVFTIEAGGVGITLTRASYIIMHDRTWVPGDVDQAIDRLHRVGQNRTVFVTMISTNEMDFVVDKVLARKSKYIDRVIC